MIKPTITIVKVSCPRGYQVILWTDNSKSDIQLVRYAITAKDAKQVAFSIASDIRAGRQPSQEPWP